MILDELMQESNERGMAVSGDCSLSATQQFIDDRHAAKPQLNQLGLHYHDSASTFDESESGNYGLALSAHSRSVASTESENIISKRLLNYGIVPLERKTSWPEPAALHVKNAVEEIHRWLFVEGGHFESVEALMSNYCLFVRDLGIPVDRLYYGGVGLHPKLTAYLWKWELDDFMFREMPKEIFEKRNVLFSPDEPFCILEQGRADFVRIRDTDSYIAPDTEKWFRGDGYTDYFALPDIHRNESKGGLAWASKSPEGFSNDHISFFELTLPALTTVMRLHTNDLVLATLTERMETEIEERTQELEDANARLAAANDCLATQGKKQLEHFACMSHEIRTPLNCIVGISSLLIESPEGLTPALAESMQMINSSAQLLNAVVDDVLDYSKMESGVFEVDIRSTSLQETINAVAHAMQEKAAQRDVKIHTIFSPTLPNMVKTDPRRLQQILYNLLGNACKFSNQGGTVELKVSLDIKETSHEQRSHVLRFSVKDYGKGIDKNDFESIFKPFNQASRETQTIYGGTGLGLSITSSLVTRLGGRISVDSVLGEYSEFVVELPFEGILPDDSLLRTAFQKTTMVLLNCEGESSSSCPFTDEVARTYGIDLVHAKTWVDVNDIIVKAPERYWADKQYILIAPSESFNRFAFRRFKMWAGNTRLVTFGIHNAPRQSQLHWKSLCRLFPTTALGAISKLHLPTRDEESGLHEDVSHQIDSKIVEEAFELLLPQKKDETKKYGQEQAVEETKDMDNTPAPRILIAEDNLVNQKVLGRVLSKLGISNVDIVDDGKKAVDISVETHYSLIFMDIQMPVMGGLEATKLIKKRDGNEGAKIVFCTAHAVEEFREQADGAGADGFVSKPFNMEKIRGVLSEHSLLTS